MIGRVLLTLPLFMLAFAVPAQGVVDAHQSGPDLITPPAKLAAALRCHDTPALSEHEPVLLVFNFRLQESASCLACVLAFPDIYCASQHFENDRC